MNAGRIVFSQLLDFMPRHEFKKCVERYHGDYRTRTFSCLDQFLCMAFAQLTSRESLRDIETCLRAVQKKLYHAGLRGKVSRNTLAKANENRPWQIYADFAQILIKRARTLYANDSFGLALKRTVYALDSTTIDLCLTLFPWAQFRRHKSAVKMHTLMDLRGNIPSFIYITGGQVHDLHLLDQLPFDPGAFYIMDKAYTDFERLYALHQNRAYFVIRAKRNLRFSRRNSSPIDKRRGLRSDQSIVLTGPKTSRLYPEILRCIHYYDEETGKRFIFLTNNFSLAPITITRLYKRRWQIELFFKWIKQHLRIKSFFGTSSNAVKTQIWIAISIYVLVAIMKKELKLERSLYEILQIISVTVLEKTPVLQALTASSNHFIEPDSCNQLRLFDF